MSSPVKRRWTITPIDGVAIITEQPARSVKPSSFVDMREPKRNAAIESIAALGRMISAAALREVPRG